MTPEQQAAADALIEAWNAEEFTWKGEDDSGAILVKFDGDGLEPGYGYQTYRILEDGTVDA